MIRVRCGIPSAVRVSEACCIVCQSDWLPMIIATGWSLSPVIPFTQPARRGLLSEDTGARQSPLEGSGNDRWNELVDDFLNLILEQELLLFEPGELQKIA